MRGKDRTRQRRRLQLVITLSALAWSGSAWAQAGGTGATEVEAARRLFEANLDAIRARDRDAYLATYLESESLARTGPTGIQLGYAAHAAGASGDNWPDVFVARNLQLVSVQPGVVYGTYRYRVAYGTDEHVGISERVFVDTPDGWRIAVTTAFDTPAGTPPPALALRGATLIDGNGKSPIGDSVVLVRDGRIECASTADVCAIPDGVEILELADAWITPGIVDAHVHFSQTGWADGRPDAVDIRDRHPYAAVQAALRARPEHFFRALMGSGVTAVFDVGGYPWTWDLRDSLRTDAPHVAAAGPLLSTRDHWLNLPAERQFIHLADEASAREGVEYLAAHGTDAVKIWFIVDASSDFEDLERSVLAAGDEARKRSLPLVVHATELRAAKVAVRAGATLLVHSVWDAEIDDEFLRLARDNGTVYCPTLTVASGYERLMAAIIEGRVPEIDDPHGCVDASLLERIQQTATLGAHKVERSRLERARERLETRAALMSTNLRRAHQAGLPVAMGTDAGNPLTLHGPSVYAEMEAMQAAGLTPMQVLVASTRGGALAMGRQADFGTVEAGKIADLLILDADPTEDIRNMRALRHVMRGGELRAASEFQRPE